MTDQGGGGFDPSEFEVPSVPGEEAGAPTPGEFEAPGAGTGDDQLGLKAADVESEAQHTGTLKSILDCRALVESSLRKQVDRRAAGAVSAEAATEETALIVGAGVAMADAENFDQLDLDPGEPALAVYTSETMDQEAVRRTLFDTIGARAAADDSLPVQAERTGEIDAFPHRFRDRPAPGGISCGHYQITAGTLGCLCRGRRGQRRNRLMILSNNHVLANSNSASTWDSVLQPGPADGGANPGDRIAVLEQFVRIDFHGQANLVDCATAWAWPNRVRRELVYVSRGRRRYFRVGSSPTQARLGLLVGKTGRTTQLTVGRVSAVGVSIKVNYGASGVALFRDQMAIKSIIPNRLFSAGGDSGSLIWTWSASRRPVGLLFAGGGGVTFANRIERALDALDVELYT